MTPPPQLETIPAAFADAEGGPEARDGVSFGLHTLDAALQEYRGRIAVVSSFGAESAVLLALVGERDPAVPVLFLDTVKHFPETLAYRHRLVAMLGLRDVRTIQASAEALAARDPSGALHAFDADACCALRKVEPLERALAPFDAWVTGRKRMQGATRAALPLSEREDGRLKVNPLAAWTAGDVEAEMRRRDLPRHPLVAQGYRSIGCSPCTQAVLPGADPRSGRWAALAKTECGIHRPSRATDGPI